jgi:hypothetical protein
MEDRVADVVETKKEWVAPELKKIDVEKITADNGFFDPDSTDVGPSDS